MKRTALILCWLLLLLAGCSRAGTPVATLAPAPTVPAVGELAVAPVASPAEVIGYLLVDADGARLVDRLRLDEPAPQPSGEQIWLGAAALPPDAALSERGGARYAVARVRGTLEGPGSFGPGGQARFQIVEPQLSILSLRDLSIPLLLSNSQLYEGQAVRLSGQLLASPSSTLLVEQLGPGGVPSAGSLQLKVLSPLDTADLGPQFSGGPAGPVRYGPAQVVGLWRGGALYLLAVQPGQ